MPDPTNPKLLWLITIASVLFAIAVLLWAVFFGSGHPPPGDVIILRPEPNDPSIPASAHWTIGGDPPTAQYEPPDSKSLNENAFTYIYEYYMRAHQDGSSTIEKVEPPEELRASFGHCADYSATTPLVPCETGADCSAGKCDISKLRITYETGAKQKLHWYLTPAENYDEIELEPQKYSDATAWRGELCGRLIGNIEATHASQPYTVPPTYGWVSIQAEPK